MKITKTKDTAKIPAKSKELDCGLDVFLPEDIELKPFETYVIGTGLSVEIPEGFAGILGPRSSIASKGIIIHRAIIDPGYKGEIHMIVTNCSGNDYFFKKGDRLCSLVCYSIMNPTINPIDDRGLNGFGSSGR